MTITVKGSTDADFPIVTITQSLDNPTSSSTTIGLVSLDAVYSQYTATGVDSNALIDVKVSNGYFPNFVVDITTPSISSYNSTTKKLSIVGVGGTASLRVTTKGLGAKEYPVTVQHLGSATTNSMTGGVSGTLMKHIWDAIAGMISGKTASPTTMQFNVGNQRNPNLFSNFDFSGWAFSGANNSLISSQHFISAAHAYGGSVGSVVSFIGSDGITYTRTITATQQINSIPDTFVGVYDSPLPATVKPFRILPSNYATKMPNLGTYFYSYPCLIICGHSMDSLPLPNATKMDTLIVSCITAKTTSSAPNGITGPTLASYTWFQGNTIFDSWGRKLAPYLNIPIDGDSNHPVMLPINGDLVLLGQTLSGFNNPDYAFASSDIQTAMNTLSASTLLTVGNRVPKSLTFADLSSFI